MSLPGDVRPPIRDVATDPSGLLTGAWQRFWTRFELFLNSVITTSSFVDNEIPSGNIDGLNMVFTLEASPNPPASLQLWRIPASGKAWPMIQGRDYILSGKQFTDSTAPTSRQSYRAFYRK